MEVKLFPSIFCLYFVILVLEVTSFKDVTYTALDPPEGRDVQYYLFDEFPRDYEGDGIRARRSPPGSTETPTEKAKLTKKPIGLDAKQASVLSDGAGNLTIAKPTTSTNKESKIMAGKILGVVTETHSSPPVVDTSSSTTAPSETVATARPTIQASGPVLLNVSLPPSETEIQITRFLDEDLNNSTLSEHNITSQQKDHHVYYNSTVLMGREKDYWVDLDHLPGVKISDILSQAHRRAVTVKLTFAFPFYGHPITNMTIATGGFLYTGDHVHAWLAATQYIAPLMANFDTSLSNISFVKYLDNGTAFTVQWENVVLQEMPDRGAFTFQCTLLDTGDIIFVYRDIGAPVSEIEENQHPVKVGLSDAYIIDRTIFFVRRKTIYEYHRVAFERGSIQNGTVIWLTALDTCLDFKDCHSCVSELRQLQCNWCSDRCSNGMDRHRHHWLQQGCDGMPQVPRDKCPAPPPQSERVEGDDKMGEEGGSMGFAGVIGIMLTLCTVLCVAVWLTYAYRYPHSTPGQFLIRYRPSQWTWRRGEARYTAATIHM